MSFGFSVGDFIKVGELCYKVYDRCSRAGKEYAALAESVSVLQDVLEETRVHLQRDVPDIANRRDALVIARLACETALNDVDALLDKYPTLGGKANKSFFERIGFITNDINGLKSRLNSSADNLARCLTSLTSVSMVRLEQTMNELLEQYKSGKREEKKSVLATAVKQNQRPDDDEAMEQVEKDLLEEEIHPDSIDMYRATIKSKVMEWLSETVSESSASKADTAYYSAAEYMYDGPSSGPHAYGSRDATQSQIQQSSAVSKVEDIRKYYTPRSTIRGSQGGGLAPPTGTDTAIDDDLYSLSIVGELIVTTPPPIQSRDRGFYDHLAPASDDQRSRRSSTASHESRASDWHPNQEPDPQYVSTMLAQPLAVDPFKGRMDTDAASLYFKRAFHGQDYRDKGYLTRNEVSKMLQESLDHVKVDLGRQSLNDLINLGDVNQDGKIDRHEFLVIVHNFWERVSDMAAENMLNGFEQDISSAMDAAKERQQQDVAGSLPWGFSRDQIRPFYDEIEETEVKEQPDLLPLHSFTLMAKEIASHSIRVLDDAEVHWTQALSKDMQGLIRDTLDKVREVAIKYTSLYRKDSEAALSDLDEMLVVLTTISESRPRFPQLTGILTKLRSTQTSCFQLARHICGFVWRLERPAGESNRRESTVSWPSARTLTKDLDRWRRARMETWAWIIAEDPSRIFTSLASGWDQIDASISECRAWYAMHHGSIKSTSSNASATDHQSPVYGTSHSWLASQHELNSEAVGITRNLAATIKVSEISEREEMRARPRACTLSRLWIEISKKKTFLMKATKYELEVLDIPRKRPHIDLPEREKEMDINGLSFGLPGNWHELRLQLSDKSNRSLYKIMTFRVDESGDHREIIIVPTSVGDTQMILHGYLGIAAPGDVGFKSSGPFLWLEMMKRCYDLE